MVTWIYRVNMHAKVHGAIKSEPEKKGYGIKTNSLKEMLDSGFCLHLVLQTLFL